MAEHPYVVALEGDFRSDAANRTNTANGNAAQPLTL